MPSCLLWVLVLQEMVTFGPQRDFWGWGRRLRVCTSRCWFPANGSASSVFCYRLWDKPQFQGHAAGHQRRDENLPFAHELVAFFWFIRGLQPESFSNCPFKTPEVFPGFSLNCWNPSRIYVVFSQMQEGICIFIRKLWRGFCKIKHLPLCPTTLGLVWLFLLVPDEWLLLILLSYCLQWLRCACNWGAIIRLWLNYMHYDRRNVQCDLWGLLT